MRIPESAIEEIRNRTDIVDVCRAFNLELKKAGDSTFKACCPFHNEKTPSFHINVSKQVYHCFGCGAGGGTIKLVEGLLNTDFPGALRWLADRYHIDIPEESDSESADYSQKKKSREEGMRLLDETAGFYESSLSGPEGASARAYLASRGIDTETIRKYRLGYAPDSWDATTNWLLHRGFSRELAAATGVVCVKPEKPDRAFDRWHHRIMFPICDELSRVVGFSGRIFEARPEDKGGKYVNSPESDFFHKSRILYGFHIARQHFKQAGWALVCEGQLDVIACHRAGLGQAFASQGTAFTEEHARMLVRSGVAEVHLAFDGDNAGMKATLHTLRLLLAANLKVEVTILPEGEDPDSIFRKGGASALQKVMGASQPAIPFVYRHFVQQNPLDTPEGKSAVIQSMLEVLAAIPDQVSAYAHCQKLAESLSLPEQLVVDQLEKRKRENFEAAQRAAQYPRAGENAGGARLPQTPVHEELHAGVFHDLQGVASLAETMLTLCAFYEPIARLWQNLELAEVMPAQTPVVRALNTVLAGTADGDWQGAVENLIQGELGADSTVSKLLTVSPFEEFQVGSDGALPEKLGLAVQDCQNRLEALRLENQQRRLAEQMSADDGSADELLLQSRELARKKNALKWRSSLPPRN